MIVATELTVVTYLAQVGLRDFLHLCEDHGGHLLWEEGLHLTLVLHFHLGLAAVVHHIEGPVLHIRLHHCVVKLTTNQTLGIWGSERSEKSIVWTG